MTARIFKLNPPQILVLGFAAIIMVGTLLLMLPIANTTGERIAFIDAFFTATSATCVTGLVVLDTGHYFSVFGQVVIAVLIQLGGLGFMTMTTLIAIVFRRKISLRERLILQQALNQNSIEGIVKLVRKVLFYSITIELIGALILTIRWSFDMPFGKALYFGVFHSISLFNNAGFDLFGDFRSLTLYVNDPVINIVSMAIIILGGLGFVVLSDLVGIRQIRKLSLHSKVVISVTSFLIIFGAVVFLFLEFTNPRTLGQLDSGGTILASFFQSITTRTTGLNTVDIAGLRQVTQFFFIILMFIGASPGSTGGGIKTTTFAILIGAVISMVKGQDDVVMFRYRIPQERIFKALTITMLSLVVVIGVTMILSTIEDSSFLAILFETTSAFGTVGLSMGLTPDLSLIGKLLISLTMFVGRLGPITLGYALSKKNKELYRHPEGKIIIG
ncbi:TrkH family potassium uptake protein [Paenibacillus sp. An7]|uniref:TrkH family potassium uptake protein n=1 Tax=Paenibacillus sp. An7 TaxID=2689577 RepID=UPI0013581F61|nr:TrkH family potassium uptake protein [Paenibacillus sp. An7]